MSGRFDGGVILRRLNLGFAVILVMTWLAEIFRFPYLFWGEPYEFNWFRILLRSFVILSVWAWAYFTISKLVRRLHHLEEFVLVCSWCRRVGQEGKWMTMEQYFGTQLDTHTSHGVCPECSQKMRDNLAQQIEKNSGKF